MDIIKELGVRGVGSYLKRVVEYMLNEVKTVYKEVGIEIEPSWLPFFVAINSRSGIAIKEIAELTNVTHSAASQAVNSMKSKNFVEAKESGEDKRVQLIYITERGKEELVKIMPVCDSIKESVEKRFENTGYNILDVIEKMENELRKSSLSLEVIEKIKKKNKEKIEIKIERNGAKSVIKGFVFNKEIGGIVYKDENKIIEIEEIYGEILQESKKFSELIGVIFKTAEKNGVKEIAAKIKIKEINLLNMMFKNGFEAHSSKKEKIVVKRSI